MRERAARLRRHVKASTIDPSAPTDVASRDAPTAQPKHPPDVDGVDALDGGVADAATLGGSPDVAALGPRLDARGAGMPSAISGTGDRRNAASDTPSRGANAIFVAGRAGGPDPPNREPASAAAMGSPQTPRCGCSHAIGPFHGWRIA